MSVIDAIARVSVLQSELASLRGTTSGTSAGADAFAAALETANQSTAAGTPTTGTATPDAAYSADASTAASVLDSAGATQTAPTVPAAPSAASGSQAGGVTGQQIVQDAEKYLGVPYVFGGESTSGMDCSGLVQKVLGDLGISAPRVVQDQAKIGTAVPSLADAQPGDLIVEKGNGHIQIYAGNGQIIEAPRPGENVVKRAEWLSPDQIGTIRRVSTAGSGPAASAAGSAAATASAAAAMFAPALTQQALTDQTTDAGATALSALIAPAASASAPASASGATGGASDPAVDALAAFASTLLQQSSLAAALPTTGTDASAAAAPAAPVPTPDLTGQLSGPIAQLVTQPDGTHTVVVRVVPEQLGPVTVNAHLGSDGMHIQLSAPSDAGRDALAGVLGDLRRDLAAGGITANLSLGADATAGDGAGSGAQSGQQALVELFQEQAAAPRLTQPSSPAAPVIATSTTSTAGATAPGDSLLDILA